MSVDFAQGFAPVGGGQADPGPADISPVTQAAPEPQVAEQPSVVEAQTATGEQPAPDVQEADLFYDPREYKAMLEGLPGEVASRARALEKQLLGSYTKKMQGLSDERKSFQQKVQAYDAFEASPHEFLPVLAKNLGYTITRAGADGQPQNNNGFEDLSSFNPQSYEELFAKIAETVIPQAEARAYERLRQEYGPVIHQVSQEREQAKQQSFESRLGEIDPAWQQYESSIEAMRTKHPTLKYDADALYKLAVPQDVQEARAYQMLVRRNEAKIKNAQISGASRTNKQPVQQMPAKATFADAARMALQHLADKGITYPEHMTRYVK